MTTQVTITGTGTPLATHDRAGAGVLVRYGDVHLQFDAGRATVPRLRHDRSGGGSRRAPRVSRATIQRPEDPEALLHWSIATCRRVVGDERAEEFGRRNGGADEVLVRVRPSNYVGASGIAD